MAVCLPPFCRRNANVLPPALAESFLSYRWIETSVNTFFLNFFSQSSFFQNRFAARCARKMILLNAALLAGPGLMATPVDAEDEQILISASRTAEAGNALPVSLQIVTAAEIKRSAASTLVQVLSAQAGLQINDNIGNQGRGASISMRGFSDNSVNNVLILVNGRKLNNPSLAGPDLASIAVQDIARIDIMQGSAGALYGDQASAGVINIITYARSIEQAYIETGRGSNDLEFTRAALSQTTAAGLSYRLSAEKKTADNYRVNNAQNYGQARAFLSYESDAFGAYIEAQNSQDDLQLPGALSGSALIENRRQSFLLGDEANRSLSVWQLGAHYDLTVNWQLLLDISDRDEDGDGEIYASDFVTGIHVRSITPRLNGRINTAAGEWTVSAGIDNEQADYQADYGYNPTAIEQELRDAYVQVLAPLAENFTFNAGSRRSEFSLQTGLMDSNGGTSFDDDISVHQMGLGYDLNKTSRVFLRRDESFRWPNADENGFIAPELAHLQAQQATSWELGGETRHQAVSLSAVFYRMNMSDEIVYDPLADGPFGPGTGANINLDASRRIGLVLTGKWIVNDEISTQLNYSRVDATLEAGNFAGKQAPFVARERANFSVSYQVHGDWSLYADGQYTGRRYRAGDSANIGGELGGYTVFNAGLRWENEALYAVLRANNLGRKQYNGYSGGLPPYDYHYPAALAHVELSVGYKF